MENEVLNQEQKVVDEVAKHNEIVEAVMAKLKDNQFNIYFYCPSLNSPSGGVGTLLRMAKILKENGFNAKIVYEPRIDQRKSVEVSQKQKKQVDIFEKFNPTWLDFDISNVEILPLGDKKIKFSDDTEQSCTPLQLNPEDFLFIPEGFPDVMRKTAQVACKKIVLAQSWMYVLSALNVGEKWQHFGITDVVSVSDAISEFLNIIMPGLNIKQFGQAIDRNTFKVPKKVSDKFPMVGFMASRGQESRMKILNVIKTFYCFYPHLKFIRFVELNGLSRPEFAERLANCAFVLYADDIAGFGTLPLEAMACKTHVVGWASYGGKEYMNATNGFWGTNGDMFQLAELIGIAFDKWLNGDLDSPEVDAAYEETLSKYTTEGEQIRILEIINEYKNERINELERIKK